MNLWFNKTCLAEGLTPDYVTLYSRNNSSSAQKAIEEGKHRWVKFELQKWYQTRDALSVYILTLHHRISQLMFSQIPPYYDRKTLENYQRIQQEFDEFDRWVRETTEILLNEKQATTYRKINKLREIKTNTTNQKSFNTTPSSTNCNQFSERVINRSSTEFTENENTLLSKGLKHSIATNRNKKSYS